MTKTLRQADLQLYTRAVSMFLPILSPPPAPENQPGLISELEADTSVGYALSSTTCQLYRRCGMYLTANLDMPVLAQIMTRNK